MVFLQLQFSEPVQFWIYWILIWIGFGLLVGLAARAIFPGEEPSSPVGVLAIGMLGCTIGPLVLQTVWRFESFHPISPLGAVASVTGASVLLVGYRFLLIVAAEQAARSSRHGSRRRPAPVRGGWFVDPHEED
ncbi:GlsB/YeaQ/YmgE family stress response membrane protein [Thermopirellula anaerolimosa]